MSDKGKISAEHWRPSSFTCPLEEWQWIHPISHVELELWSFLDDRFKCRIENTSRLILKRENKRQRQRFQPVVDSALCYKVSIPPYASSAYKKADGIHTVTIFFQLLPNSVSTGQRVQFFLPPLLRNTSDSDIGKVWIKRMVDPIPSY